MKRICGLLLTLVLLPALVPMATVTTPVAAAEKETILLAGSDFQVANHNTSRVEQVLGTLEIHGITKADGAFFCGDYTLNSVDDNQDQSTYGLGTLKRLFQPIVGNNMTFVQGNHDPKDTVGLSKSGNNDPASNKYGVYVIHEDEYLQYNWDYSKAIVEKTAANLKKYLDEKVKIGWNKPIFVLSHVGLHWGNRTIKEGSAIHGELLVDVLNEAGEKGLNIIFLYGHDHSGGYADYLGGSAIYFKKGDQIEVCTGEKKGHHARTIKFTYMNAGYIGYYTTNSDKPSDCDTAVTMSVFRIKGNEVIITRYDGNVNLAKEQYGIHNLKSKGAYSDYFYEKNGYHVDINTLEYASSRKVTATDDVPVDTPMPGQATEPTTTTTRTVGSGIAVNKTTTGKAPTTTKPTHITGDAPAGSEVVTTAPTGTTADPTATKGAQVTEPSVDVTAPSEEPTQPTEQEENTASSESGIEEDDPPLGLIIGIAGGSVLVAAAMVILGIVIKKKRQ